MIIRIAFIDRYKYDMSICSNNDGFYYVVGDKIHLRIFTQQSKIWSIANNDRNAMLECPIEAFFKILMPVKAEMRNPFKIYDIPKSTSTSKSPSIDVIDVIPASSYPSYSVSPCLYHSFYSLYILSSPYPEHRILQYRVNRYGDEDRDESHELRSSPSMDRDSVEHMIKYFN